MFTSSLFRSARSSLPKSQLSRPLVQQSRAFSVSTFKMVKVGDSIPNVELWEDSPGNKINIANELSSGKGLIIGTPAAFSPGCSDTHVPGYIADPKTKGFDKVFVIAVNDAFVMKAWGKQLDADKSSGLRFLGDAAAEFTKALEVDFDASPLMGNHRSKRYAITTENGKVTKFAVEPDNFGVNVSAAENFL